MGFSQEAGYVPTTIETIMLSLMENINEQFQPTPLYTAETFIGTNFYKNAYALAQRMQQNEVKTGEIFLKLQQYFIITNERIARPVVTSPGTVELLEANGYIASLKKIVEADAGKRFVCVDVDHTAPDYAATKLAICTLIKNATVGGVVTMGDQSESLTLSNGQSFDFKFNLPNRIAVLLKLTLTLSDNNQVVVKTPDEVKSILMANIAARYRLGKNFEPQRYFSISDAPWAGNVLLEYSVDDGSNWASTVYDSAYDDLFEIDLENIEVVEA